MNIAESSKEVIMPESLNNKAPNIDPEKYGKDFNSRITRIKMLEKLDNFPYKTLEEFYSDYETISYFKENYDLKEDGKYIVSDEIIDKFKFLLRDFVLRKHWEGLGKKMKDDIMIRSNNRNDTSFMITSESFISELDGASIEVGLNTRGKLVIVEKEREDDDVYETEEGDVIVLTYNPDAVSPSRQYRRDYEVSVNWIKQTTIDSTRLRNWWDTFVIVSEDSDDGFRFIVNPTDENYSQWNGKKMFPFQFK